MWKGREGLSSPLSGSFQATFQVLGEAQPCTREQPEQLLSEVREPSGIQGVCATSTTAESCVGVSICFHSLAQREDPLQAQEENGKVRRFPLCLFSCLSCKELGHRII